ncbi:ATG protein [Ancylostoma caninum]|uniref:Autophagy-related protein 2 n=1 Tax=Ancylostoma caninum TaxID=29170 RepID=A0A368HD04_ANCCA|nr:ATG protein [Ancylostoma caninum]
MKLSDFNITDRLHNRWCRFIIQRYLGQFLEQNLTLDQLSIELYAGKLTINDVKINAHYVNELLTSMNVPLRLTDGFVGGITIEVPWFSLASEASKMKIHQLELTFQSREGVKLDNKDLVSSMIGSVVESLVSSSDLARSFYENEKQAGEEEFDTDAEDGVKAFATVIDAIVSRFCMELTETTIRFENPPKSMSALCTAVEIRLKEVRFMDEQMRNCQQEGRSAETITSQPQGMGSIANLNKFIDMSGVEIFTDVFTEIEDQYSDPNSSQIITSMYIRREKQKHKSPTLSTHESISTDLFTSALSSSTANFQSCYSNINAGETNQTIGEQFRVAKVDNDRELKSNPVKFAEFVGESRMIFRIKNSDAVADKKDNRVEIESFFTGLHCFILPSQIDILKRFFSSIALPQTEKLNDFGKKMDKSDYDAMAKNIEEETFQRTRMTTLGMQGTWSRREDFHEFDSINLEDNRTSRKMSEACRDNYKTIKSENTKKESTILSAKIGMVLIYIPHNDIMSVEYTKSLNNGYFEAVDLAIEESNAFFARATKVSVKHSNLHTTRNILDRLYFKDHLRLVGSSVVFHYQMDKNGSGEHMKAKLIFPSVDIIEYLTPESNPRDPENTHMPLLDFSKFENPDQEPQLKFEFSASSAMVDESKTFIYIGKCRCELDLSIVDRIADLFEPRPFFDLPSYKRSRKDPLQLREDLFSMPLVEQSNKIMVVVKCQALELDLRVPMADLRNPGVARLPYRQRHVHPEYIGLHVSSVTVEVPLGGESTVFELFATEIYGSFCGVSDKFTCSDEDRRFLWGGQTSVDEPVHMKFEYDPRNKALKASSTKIHCVAGLGINDDMAKSISLSVIQSLPRREGPFAQTHRSFLHNHEEGNDLILAGSREEMTSFGAKCILQSIMVISLDIPILRVLIPSHSYLEVLYNRLVNDLLLWQPAAPAVRPGEEEFKINALSDDMFHECGGDPMDRFDDECEEERFNTLVQSNGYDKNKSHVLSLLLNVKKGTVVMCTALKEEDEEKGVGQVSVELADAQLFAVGGYHGRMTDTYFYFTTHTIGVGHRNVCTMPKVVNQPDFGKWSRDDTQMDSIPSGDEFSTQSPDDAVGVAIFLCERPGQNIKDVLLAIAVRNTSLQVRPFSNLKETWAFQLADLFTLQDYPIPGYELPVVTTDLHIHLDNVILAYDHVWTNPESDLRLRLVLGESDISSSIIQDMNMAKVTSIFESAQVFMSNAKKSKDNVRFEEQRSSKNVTTTAPPKRKFFKVVDVGLFQLEVSFESSLVAPEYSYQLIDPVSQFLSSFVAVSESAAVTSPVLEIRCRNDIIKAWACADSLVALLNIVSEIAKSDKYSALPLKKASSARQSTDSFESAAASEQDTPVSSTTQSAVTIPKPVEMKMKRMLASAMQERTISSSSSGAIPCGRDALEEFSPNFSTSQAKADLLADALGEMSHSDRNRAYSLSTDDEFCMVDEDVIGSGITNSAGEPNIKYIGSQPNRSTWNNGVNIDPHYFRVPSDWRGDGLAALPADFPSPLIRYLVRDISISLHLYGGSDLSEFPPRERSYSTSEYREGKGKNQVVSSDAFGGKHRDHSVCVVLELNKITCVYQLFGKDAPLMSMKLFTIHNITLLDKLTASQIKEMMYQYSSAEQPRRTCAPMLAVRMVESHKCEGKMRVSMLPIKFNIDQDTMEFLDDFFQEVRTSVDLPSEVSDAISARPILEVPASVHSNNGEAAMETSHIYPSLEREPPLNLDVLTPEAAPSPIYDLSYLEHRSRTESPVKRPLADAPLTASAVSIGDLFGTKSRASQRISPVEEVSPQSSSPDLVRAEIPTEEETLAIDDLHLAGDWSTSSEIRLSEDVNDFSRFPDLDPPATDSSVDRMLKSASMHDSFHPDTFVPDDDVGPSTVVSEELVDTSSDIADCSNDADRSTICDEETSTQMAESSNDRRYTPEPSESTRGSTFFKEFIFSPAVSIYVDYHGKNRINIEKNGAVFGVLTGIGQLNRTEFVLKEIVNRNGLLGVGRCVNVAVDEWLSDIRSNLPNVLASCGPISPIVQIGKGVMDLFWLPVAELRKEDGHVVKGIQKGVGSFGMSSAAGVVGMAQTVVGVIQVTFVTPDVVEAVLQTDLLLKMLAESVLREVQPTAPYLNERNRRAVAARAAAPTDLRHGMRLAYDIASDGYRQARDDLELAAQEDRASGQSSFRSVLNVAPKTFIRPLVVSTQIGYQLLGGLRAQLRPDVYQDERHKWKDEEVPGGSGQH